MKNIFDFATKELSQDAFLRWLLENWNCNDKSIQKASQLLLFDFLGIDRSSKITSLKTMAQYKKIDILVDCVIDGENYIIAIEDKMYSVDHGLQLENNKNHLKEYNNKAKQKFIFDN